MPRILAVKENNMSSPFSKNFLSKNPITLTQRQKENLPPNLVEEIVKQEEKKQTPLTMVDYTDYGTESGYVSTRASLQNMFDGITKGTLAAMEGLKDPQTQADRLGRRLDKRKKRALRRAERVKKGDLTEKKVPNPNFDPNKKISVDNPKKISKFNLKTEKIKGRQEEFQDKADADMQRRIDQAKSLRSASGRFSKDFGDSAKAGYESVYGEGSWDKATDKQKTEFIKR